MIEFHKDDHSQEVHLLRWATLNFWKVNFVSTISLRRKEEKTESSKG